MGKNRYTLSIAFNVCRYKKPGYYIGLQVSKMNRLFGAAQKEEAQVPQPPKKEESEVLQPPKKSSLSLIEQQAKLEIKVKQLSETISKLDIEAKDLFEKSKKAKGTAKDMYKQRCVTVLRKRKQYDNQLKNYMSQQFTLDQIAFTTDNIQSTIQMAEAMQEAVQLQKGVMKGFDLDKLDDLRDEMDQLKYESDYMNEMLNRDYYVEIDEDDLDDQLGELEKELKKEKNEQRKKKEEVVPQPVSSV